MAAAMTDPSMPIPVNRHAVPNVSRDSQAYGNMDTGEMIIRTYDGRTHTVMRLRYPDPNYPDSVGRECSDVLLRTTSNAHVRQWFEAMNAGQTKGKFRKLKRSYMMGPPVEMEMGEDKLPNPQEFTQTSWGDGQGHGEDPSVESENPFSGQVAYPTKVVPDVPVREDS